MLAVDKTREALPFGRRCLWTLRSFQCRESTSLLRVTRGGRREKRRLDRLSTRGTTNRHEYLRPCRRIPSNFIKYFFFKVYTNCIHRQRIFCSFIRIIFDLQKNRIVSN